MTDPDLDARHRCALDDYLITAELTLRQYEALFDQIPADDFEEGAERLLEEYRADVSQNVNRFIAQLQAGTMHTPGCLGGEVCEPVTGVWQQPAGNEVAEAMEQLGEHANWCQIHDLAWSMACLAEYA